MKFGLNYRSEGNAQFTVFAYSNRQSTILSGIRKIPIKPYCSGSRLASTWKLQNYFRSEFYLSKMSRQLPISRAACDFSRHFLLFRQVPSPNSTGFALIFKSKPVMFWLSNNSLCHNRNLSIDGFLCLHWYCASTLKKNQEGLESRGVVPNKNRIFPAR